MFELYILMVGIFAGVILEEKVFAPWALRVKEKCPDSFNYRGQPTSLPYGKEPNSFSGGPSEPLNFWMCIPFSKNNLAAADEMKERIRLEKQLSTDGINSDAQEKSLPNPSPLPEIETNECPSYLGRPVVMPFRERQDKRPDFFMALPFWVHDNPVVPVAPVVPPVN